MQQRTRVTIDDDDDDDVEEEVTDTIEKFVQTRHVQTLKYLRHVIDENRHLRLHIEHLKRRQNDSIPSPAVVDPFEPEDSPISAIPLSSSSTPEPAVDFEENCDKATNTDGDDFQSKCQTLEDELVNLRKQHHLNRDEFQRELERMDRQNNQLEQDFKSAQQQLILVQKRDNDKQLELDRLSATISDEQTSNQTLILRVKKMEQTNRLLTQSLTASEQTRLELESQLEEARQKFEENEQKVVKLQTECKDTQTLLDTTGKETDALKETLRLESDKCQELTDENRDLKESVQYLQRQLQEKLLQEQENHRERQLNSNFKDFVQVRRTLQACQQENEQLRIEVKKLQIKLLNKD